MKAYFYPKSIYTSIVAFADLFNNMTTRVYDHTTNKIVGAKKVPVNLNPKEKIASILTKTTVNDVDPQQDNYLPRISVNMAGMVWDPARMRGKFEKRLLNIEYSDNGRTRSMQRDTQPMPWNLTFDVTVWTKYMTDALQLFENIAVWFGPENHVSFKERNFGLEHKAKITLDNVTPNIVFELGEQERRVIQHNYTFTMETVLYKPIELTPEIACAIIKVANVPCEKIPFEGGAIYINDNNTQTVVDPQISAAIRDLDDCEEYNLMVRYWESANNSMSSSTLNPTEPTYAQCVLNHCIDPVPPQPVWNSVDQPDTCGPNKQPSRIVRGIGDGPDGHDTISMYSQEIVNQNNILSIVSYRTTIDDNTNEIIEENVIIPNDEFPSGNDFDGDGVDD